MGIIQSKICSTQARQTLRKPIILCYPRSYNEAKVTQKPSKWEEDQLYFLDINSH